MSEINKLKINLYSLLRLTNKKKFVLIMKYTILHIIIFAIGYRLYCNKKILYSQH